MVARALKETLIVRREFCAECPAIHDTITTIFKRMLDLGLRPLRATASIDGYEIEFTGKANLYIMFADVNTLKQISDNNRYQGSVVVEAEGDPGEAKRLAEYAVKVLLEEGRCKEAECEPREEKEKTRARNLFELLLI